MASDEMFLAKENIPFVRTGGGLFRIDPDKWAEITDPDSSTHIFFRASETSWAEVVAMLSRLRRTDPAFEGGVSQERTPSLRSHGEACLSLLVESSNVNRLILRE